MRTDCTQVRVDAPIPVAVQVADERTADTGVAVPGASEGQGESVSVKSLVLPVHRSKRSPLYDGEERRFIIIVAFLLTIVMLTERTRRGGSKVLPLRPGRTRRIEE